MVVILGILAAAVVVNVVGLMGRGQEESYATDVKTIQTAVSVFYADIHAFSADGGWNETDNITSVHNFPTWYGNASSLFLGTAVTIDNKWEVWEVWSAPDTRATTRQIEAAAIWMGLLTNAPGYGDTLCRKPNDDYYADVSPLAGENGPYLNPLPDSCSTSNSPQGKGTYTWILGEYGRVYGVFQHNGTWYAGFGGRYP